LRHSATFSFGTVSRPAITTKHLSRRNYAMTRFYRTILASTLIALTGTVGAIGADLRSNGNQGQGNLVDLSSARLSGQSATVDNKSDTPLVDVSNKKKKPQPTFWNRLVHPSQWFSGQKKK
jgi:hypothetical protein